MKRLLSFAVLLLMLVAGVSKASAAAAFDIKKVSDVVFTYAQYAPGVTVGYATPAQAAALAAEVGDKLIYNNGTANVAVDGAVAFDATYSYIIAATDAQYFVDFYDKIDEAENTLLPTLALGNHGGWGSKFSDAANVSADAKTQVGDLTNNAPEDGLKASIAKAKDALNKLDSEENDYGVDPKTSLENDMAGFQKMFTDLEAVRDSLGLLYDYANGNYAGTSYKVIDFPGADDMFNSLWESLVSTYKTATNYQSVASTCESIVSLKETLDDNAKQYADDPEFLEVTMKVKNGESIGTQEWSGKYPKLDDFGLVDYPFSVLNPTKQIAMAIKTFVTEQAKWSQTAPTPASIGTKIIDVATMVATIGLAGNLMARDIMLMMLYFDVAKWVNEECKTDHVYDMIVQQLRRSKGVMSVAESAAAVQTEYDIMKMIFERAKEIQDLELEQDKLQALIYDVQDVYYDMETTREVTDLPHAAKKNLREYLNRATEAMRKDYVVKTVTYTANGQYDLYDMVIHPDNYNFGVDEKPADKIKREVTTLQNALSLFTRQYTLEEKLDEVFAYKDEVQISLGDQKEDAKLVYETLLTAYSEGETFNLDVSAKQKTEDEIIAEINTLNEAMTTAKQQQEKIQAALDEAQNVLDEMVNNGPTDQLEDALKDAYEKFQVDANVDKIIDDLKGIQVFTDETFDDPDYYLDYMITGTEQFFEQNIAKMTPTQISAIQKALAAGKIALSEWKDSRYNDEQDSQTPLNDYDELEREYLLKRMYYAALALEYVQKMTIMENPDADTADTQLAEAIALVAISAASSYGDLNGIEQALAEANLLYRDEESTETEKTATARKLLSLIKGTTGIANVEGKAQLRDGKMIENGRLIIVKGGKKFNANGVAQ